MNARVVKHLEIIAKCFFVLGKFEDDFQSRGEYVTA